MPVIHIISIWSKINDVEGALRGRNHNFEYDVTVPEGRGDTEALELAFALTNRDDRPHGQSCCSTTSGDIMVLRGQHYLVDPNGYHALTPEESTAIQALTSRDTSFGYSFLKKHKLI